MTSGGPSAVAARAFDIDVLACPRCGGRLRLIGTVEDPDAIRAILVAVAGSRELADRAPPFPPAGAEHQPRDGDRGLSALRTPPSPRPVRSCRGGGSLPSFRAPLPSTNPLGGSSYRPVRSPYNLSH